VGGDGRGKRGTAGSGYFGFGGVGGGGEMGNGRVLRNVEKTLLDALMLLGKRTGKRKVGARGGGIRERLG